MNFDNARRYMVPVWVLVAAIFATAAMSITGAYYGFKAAAPTVTVEGLPATVNTSPPTPSATNEVGRTYVSPNSAAELVPGAGVTKFSDDDAFQCKAKYDTVQVPIGRSKFVNGAEYTLKDNNPGRDEYEDQTSVTATIKLSAHVSAPTIIVGNAAHDNAPTMYSDALLEVNLTPGATGVYTLMTEAYAFNHRDTGITDITICTKVS